jgi:hypothetical protein
MRWPLELGTERHIIAPVEHVCRVKTDRFEPWFCPAPWRGITGKIPVSLAISRIAKRYMVTPTGFEPVALRLGI